MPQYQLADVLRLLSTEFPAAAYPDLAQDLGFAEGEWLLELGAFRPSCNVRRVERIGRPIAEQFSWRIRCLAMPIPNCSTCLRCDSSSISIHRTSRANGVVAAHAPPPRTLAFRDGILPQTLWPCVIGRRWRGGARPYPCLTMAANRGPFLGLFLPADSDMVGGKDRRRCPIPLANRQNAVLNVRCS